MRLTGHSNDLLFTKLERMYQHRSYHTYKCAPAQKRQKTTTTSTEKRKRITKKNRAQIDTLLWKW